MVRWHLGTVGFSYKEWQGVFYPAGLPSRNYLHYYAERFNSVEIDSTFYGVPPAAQMARWASVTPDDFTFALKTPRAVTHDLRLVDAGEEMAAFLNVARVLEEKLGPILIQLPPDFTAAHTTTLMRFLQSLPDDLRFAIEFRDRSWQSPGTEALLAHHSVAWVSADYIHLPATVIRTSDFLFLRWLGRHGRYQAKSQEQRDATGELQAWWSRLAPHLDSVSDVFGYFNNDYAGYSPATCNRFKQIAGLPPSDLGLIQQGRLF